MKQKLAIVLFILLVFASGGISVSAAKQQTADEFVRQVSADAAAETIDAVGALAAKTETVTNPTAAGIQKKLDMNKDGQYNLTVKIPPGTYSLTKTLYVYPNTTIIATGATLVKQKNYGAMVEAKLTNDNGGYNGNHDITIQGGTWDSEPCMKNTGTESFRFIHCNNITIKNAKLCNVPEGSHLIVLAGVKNAVITNCEFSGYGTEPKKGYLSAKSVKEAIQLDIVRKEVVPTNQAAEIKNWDDLPCDTVKISGCSFHEFSRGIGSHTAVAGMLHNRVTIENNTFKNLSDSAIRLYNYKNTVVKGNRISNSIEGILIYTYIEISDENAYFQPTHKASVALPSNYNITVSDNIIKNITNKNKAWGDGIRVIGCSSRKLSGVVIKNNRISALSRYGIYATMAPDLSIMDNLIETPETDGILLTGCSSSVIGGNNISKSGAEGIAVYRSDKMLIYGNTVASAKGDGIYLLDSDYCTIGKSRTQCNTIRSPGKNGILISQLGSNGAGCSNTAIQYNQILNTKKNGILVYKSINTKVRGNTVNNTKESGIFISTKSKYASVLNNKVYRSGQNGISLTSSSKYGTIQGNTITEYGTANVTGSKFGIMIYISGGSSKSNTVVLKNKVTGTGKKSGRNAIYLSSSSYVTVSGNTINKADGAGIYLYKSSNSVIGRTKKDANTIKNSKEYGIYIACASQNVKAQYNKITGAKKAGVGVYDAKKSTVKGNVISSETDGIDVNTNSSYALITGNTINSAGRMGISLSEGSRRSTITNNTIKKYSVKKSSGSGIYINKAGGTGKKNNTVVSGNKITGTGKSKKKNAIKVMESAYTTLKKNTIKNAAGSGIYIYNSRKNTVENNKISVPNKNGIYISTGSGTATIKGNTVTKAGDVSIMLYGAPSSRVTSNKVTGVGKYIGIWARASNKTTIKNNTIQGTKNIKAVSVSGSLRCIVSKNKISTVKAQKKKTTSKGNTSKSK